jgi:DNA-binding GntR family transcriptional regulator
MTDEHRPTHDEKSDRILAWLYEHRGEFEGEGVSEQSLASAVGLSEPDVTEAVDRLESREAVARVPRHGAPGSFVLQPARGWADISGELGKEPAG